MTESEVLEKLNQYKEAILKLKVARDNWKNSYEDLKHKTYLTIKHLVEDNIEVKEKEIQDLKESLKTTNNLLMPNLETFISDMDDILELQ